MNTPVKRTKFTRWVKSITRAAVQLNTEKDIFFTEKDIIPPNRTDKGLSGTEKYWVPINSSGL